MDDGGQAVGRAQGARRLLRPYGLVLVAAFGFQPFIAFLAANGEQVSDGARVLLYGVVTVLLGVGALALIGALRPQASPERTAVVVALVLTALFSFDLLMGDAPKADQVWIQIALWAVVTAAVAWLGYRLSAFEVFRRALVVFAVVFLAVPSVTYVLERGREGGVEPPAEDLSAADVPDLEGEAPNVYWFILDEYGRNDHLQSIIGYDNSAFYEGMEDLGFTVYEDTIANYSRTHLSVSSTLQMDYIAEPGNDIVDEYTELTPILRGDNNTVRRFRAHGYDFVYSDYGSYQWLSCTEERADVCLPAVEPPRSIDELDQALLKLTPLRSLGLFSVPYTTPVQVLAERDRAQDRFEEPFFLLAHIGSPHWPYRYDDRCSPRDVPVDAYQLHPDDRAEAYVQDLECTNQLMLTAAAEIAESDPTALVVVQSDHGSTFLLDWDLALEDWADEALQERFSVINAIRFPPACEDLLPESMSLVNTFRLVFACIEDTEPDLLPDRSYLSPYDDISGAERIPPERLRPSG